MKILCVFGQHNYGKSERGEGYEYSNFIPALQNLGHEVSFFESLDKSAYKDFVELNRTLLETVTNEAPDIIFFVLMGYEVWLETFDIIRKGSNAALIQWATDDSWKYDEFSHFMVPVFDVYATTYQTALKKAERDGHNNCFLTQWAANSQEMKNPLAATQCRYNVSFLGTAYGNRKRWIAELRKNDIEVECFGYGWPNGPVDAEHIPRIMRESVISLNFGDSGLVLKNGKPVRDRQIKARIFEVPGAGGMLLTEPADHLEDYYRVGDEIISFSNVHDLSKKINYFLSHKKERDAVAQAGFGRTRQDHTYEARFQPLLAKALARRGLREKVSMGIDFDDFNKLVIRHRSNLMLNIFRKMLLAPCLAIWGRKRGPRAARRILFELSWRLVGGKTYSVSGWPGRMFYKDS